MQTTVDRDYKKHSYSFIFGASDTYKEVLIDPVLGIKGEVVKFILTLPDWTNTVTAVVTMINSDSKEIFESASKAQNDEYDVTLDRNECIILGKAGEKWKITLSGVPGGTGGTATLTPYLEG